MRCSVLLALLLTACGDGGSGEGGAGEGDPCSATTLCGDGLVCDMTDPAGAACVDADADGDGDGLPNKQDFCQHQAGGRFDEDLDGIGDDCDKCPIAPPPATPDTDGDDVDSPCDPDPSTAGDKIAIFDGFNDGAVPTGWRATTGVKIQGGEAVLTPASPTAVETLDAPLPFVSSHTAILAGWRVDSIDGAATEHLAAATGTDRRPAGTSVISCGASRIGVQDRLQLDTDASASQDSVDDLFNTASRYRAALLLEGASAQCALITDHDTGAAQAATLGNSMSEAGVTAKGAVVRFSYLLAIQRTAVQNP